jgi:hypothetical protein
MSEKIGPHHLERKAILYVPQSSAQPHITLVNVPEPGLPPHSQPPANHRDSES